MPKPTLYDIDADLREIEDALWESGGDIDDEIDDRYATLLDAREDKVDGYYALIRTFSAEAEKFSAEEERMAGKRKAAENAARRLKDRLLASMQARGERELAGRLGKVKVQKAGTRPVELLVDPDDLPERFRRVTVATDSRALAAALKGGDAEAQAVARLGEATEYLRLY